MHMSVFEYACEKKKPDGTVCGRPRIIPSGSQTPRCPKCEPAELWLEAEAAYKKREETP